MYAENSLTTAKQVKFYLPPPPPNCHKELFRLFVELRPCLFPKQFNVEHTQQKVSYRKCTDQDKSIHSTHKLETYSVFSIKKFLQKSTVYKANIHDVDLENRKVIYCLVS